MNDGSSRVMVERALPHPSPLLYLCGARGSTLGEMMLAGGAAHAVFC
jgi:hypothetical protein